MNVLARLLVVLFVVPAAFYFTYWVPFSLLPDALHGTVAFIVSLAVAGTAGWFAWTGMSRVSSGAIASVMRGAVIVGGIGFCIGFFGPMIFAPDANQGPLLGIFITGPLGFALGAIGGLVHWFLRGRERVY